MELSETCSKPIRRAYVFAGGRGLRFHPYSKRLPKPLFEIEGEPIVVRNVRQIAAAFETLERITVLVGYLGDEIKKRLSLLNLNVFLDFVEVSPTMVSMGLLGGFAQIAEAVTADETILCALGDEFYLGDDHARFASFLKHNADFACCCAVKRIDTIDEYLKNYAVVFKDERVIDRVVEKPSSIISEHYGLGMFAVKGLICHLAAREIHEGRTTSLIDLLNHLPERTAGPLVGFEFRDGYTNINTPSDIYNCLRQVRGRLRPTIDVIIPAWNEALSIAYVVRDFLPVCRSVIVMDNNSPDGTADIARREGAVVYSEPLRGYGDAIKKGLDRSDADILVIVEADGTFRAKDMEKLLVHLVDVDAVIGSRTHWHYVEYGANMGFLQRTANVAYGLLISYLWWNRKSRLTDVGCSFRAMWRRAYKTISGQLVETGPEFAPEVVIQLLESWLRVIEVPVPYHSRFLGTSKFSGSFLSLSKTAMRMLRTILIMRVASWWSNLSFVIKEHVA